MWVSPSRGVDAFDARARIWDRAGCTYRGVLVVVALAGDLHADFAGNLWTRERKYGTAVSVGALRTGNSSDRVPNPRTWRWEKCGADARLLTLRMPLDQIALLSFTSTRTSEVFMTFCANFFTCWRRGRGGGERGCSGKKDSSPREREAGEPGPRWADGNDPSPGDARHRSSRTASRCPIHNVNDRTPRRSGEPTVVTRVDAASRASHRRLALIAARLSRGWALTACTARGALFLKVSPWTALARLMVYSRVTTS